MASPIEPDSAELNRPTSAARVSPRERVVLTSIIEHYIATGEPVASQAIARQQNREGMSPATVRNVMAELSDAGFLDQPHTSAGRIPTPRAFRYYVEQLLRRGTSSGDLLAAPAQEQIDESFNVMGSGVMSAEQFLSHTSHVLALLTGGVGVALTHGATSDRDLLEHIHFTRLTRAKVLAVVVTTLGQVRDRILLLDYDLTSTELEAAAHYLNQNFHAWSFERIRVELALRLEQERGEYTRWLRSLEQLCLKGALDAALPQSSVFVEGASNLIASEADRERLQQILAALEEKQRVIDLLHAYVDDHQQSVRVVVGLEDAMPQMENLTLIAAPARLGEDRLGTVAVIGPTRMQYENAIGGVTYIATLFERLQKVL